MTTAQQIESTAQRIEAAFRQSLKPLTIRQIQQMTGLHPAVIRYHVKKPQYSRVDAKWATRQWENVWILNRKENHETINQSTVIVKSSIHR